MVMKVDHSARPAFMGYLYQIRISLLMSFDLPEDSIIYIEKGDDIEIQHEDKEDFIQLKHKKEHEILTDYATDFWKSATIWLKMFDNKKDSQYLLYTTSSFNQNSTLKKLCYIKKLKFSEDDIRNLMSILDQSTSSHLNNAKQLLEKLSIPDQILFFNRITILEDNLRIEEVKDRIIDFKLRFVNDQHRLSFFNEFEGWWVNQVITMMSKNNGITTREISLKLHEINQKYFENNLPSPNEFLDDIDYSQFLDRDLLFIRKGKAINLKKSQIKWCIIDYLRTYNDRNYWIENALISWDEIKKYERRLEEDFYRKKDMVYDDEDDLDIEERIKIGKILFEWVQERNTPIRPNAQISHICKGTYYLICDDDSKNFNWLP